MSNPTGTIQSIRSDQTGVRARVEIDVTEACPRCASGKGCGAGLSSGTERKRTLDIAADEQMPLDVGDHVELVLAPDNLLAAAFIAYGLPLLGGLAAAAAAYLLGFGDALAAAMAIVGLAVGILVGRRKLQQPGCIDDFVPHIEKNLRNAGH